RAGSEMGGRGVALCGRRAKAMWGWTFHGMCVRVMRRGAKTLGMSSNFSIYDADDTKRLVTLVIRDLDLDPKKHPPRGVANQISDWKNELVDVEAAAAAAADGAQRVAAEVYAEDRKSVV